MESEQSQENATGRYEHSQSSKKEITRRGAGVVEEIVVGIDPASIGEEACVKIPSSSSPQRNC